MRSIVTVGGAVFIILGLVATGAAQTPVTYSACVLKDGTLRMVSQSQSCKNNETRISWNSVGPQGPPGPPGQSDPVNVTVHCGGGQTVGAALAQGASRSGQLTITIEGTCIESVTIRRDDVTLVGASPTDGLQAPDATSNPLQVTSAQRVTLSGLHLQGGSQNSGLIVRHGAAVSAFNLSVVGASWGIGVDGAVFECGECTVEGNLIGVGVNLGSRVSLWHSTVRNNGHHGVFANGGSVLLNNTTVEGNAGAGVMGWTDGQIGVEASTIQGNTQGGISLQQATVQVDQDSFITGNSQSGIGLWFGARANLRHVTIEDNDVGITAYGGSVVLFGGDSQTTATIIRGNHGDGVQLNDTSVAGAGSTTGVLITGNAQHGVFCAPAPAVAQITTAGGPSNYSLNASNVLGNTVAPQISCPGFVVQ